MNKFDEIIAKCDAKAQSDLGDEVTISPEGGEAFAATAILGDVERSPNYDDQGTEGLARRDVTVRRAVWANPAVNDEIVIDGEEWRVVQIDEQDKSTSTLRCVLRQDKARHNQGHYVRTD